MIEKIINILVSELEYSEYAAQITAQDLVSLQPELQVYLEQWLFNRVENEVVINKFSTSYLIKKRGFSYPAALIAMDWLLTDPLTAEIELSSDIEK